MQNLAKQNSMDCTYKTKSAMTIDHRWNWCISTQAVSDIHWPRAP